MPYIIIYKNTKVRLWMCVCVKMMCEWGFPSVGLGLPKEDGGLHGWLRLWDRTLRIWPGYGQNKGTNMGDKLSTLSFSRSNMGVPSFPQNFQTTRVAKKKHHGNPLVWLLATWKDWLPHRWSAASSSTTDHFGSDCWRRPFRVNTNKFPTVGHLMGRK